MKLTTIVLLTACISAAAGGHAQKVTLSVKNAPVQTVFKEVSRQTGISIVYNEAMLQGMAPVSLQVKNATVQQVLDKCMANQLLTYTIQNGVIV